MKNTIRLTESDLINLIQKVIKEQSKGSDSFEDELEMDDINDEEEMVRQYFERQHRQSDPNEFTLMGKIQRNRFRAQFREKNYAHFVLRTINKTEDGTGILGGRDLEDYENKVVKITGITQDGKPPSFKNPLKLTKKPQVLSR